MEKLTFNPNQVRKSFKSYVCGEFILPSGKPSGYYKFPISEEEINEYMNAYPHGEKPKKFLTWSEWALSSALRNKYGLNYLQPKKQVFLSHIDEYYNPHKKEEESLEDKMIFYCDMKLNDILKMAMDTAANLQPEPVTEKSEKKFRASLDNSDFDVLY